MANRWLELLQLVRAVSRRANRRSQQGDPAAAATPSVMTAGNALGCLFLLALATGLAVFAYGQLEPTFPELRLGVSIVSALFLAGGLSILGGVAVGYRGGESSRRGVLRRARSGTPPKDGKPMLAFGVVRPLGEPLIAPFSGTPCVSYMYRMYHVHRPVVSFNVATGAGGQRLSRAQIVVHGWGYRSTPFALDGPSGRVQVFGAPRLEIAATSPTDDEAMARARRFLQNTQFEPMRGNAVATVSQALSYMAELLTDADGDVRRDFKREGADVDPADVVLEECVLPVGGEASVHGPWSSSRGAIVAPGRMLAESHLVATLGPPEANLDRLEVEHSVASKMVSGLLLTGVGAGAIWFFRNLPSWQ